MPILSYNTHTTGLVGESVEPRRVTMVSTDNIATITSAGYMNKFNQSGSPLQPTDIIDVLYDFNEQTKTSNYGRFQPTFSLGENSTITLALIDPGAVVTPTTVGHIATYTNTTGTLSEDAAPAINGGDIWAGLSGTAGLLRSFPAGAFTGSLALAAQNAAADVTTSIRNSTSANVNNTLTIPFPGATGSFLVSTLPEANISSNLIALDITFTSALLAAAGTVDIFVGDGTKQYRVRNMYLNSGTNFSGGGGDRDISVSDGTTVYTVIPAATAQALPANAAWGSASIPLPASAPMSTSTAAGVSLQILYSGGTADYAAGSSVLTVLLERVA